MMFSQRFQCTRYLFLGSYLNFDSHSFRLSNYFQGLPWLTQLVKNLWATQETQVQFLSQEDALERGIATHCSILAWRIP